MQVFSRIAVFAVYLVATTGLYVHMHYCGGDLTDVGLFGTCGADCCDDTEASECCDSENIYISLEDEHRVVPTTLVRLVPAMVHRNEIPDMTGDFVLEQLPENPINANAPPEPAYLRFQRLIYYG